MIIEHSQIIEACRGIGMLGAEHLLENLCSLYVQRLSFGVLADTLVKRRQVVEAPCCIWMLRAEHFLPNLAEPFLEGVLLWRTRAWIRKAPPDC